MIDFLLWLKSVTLVTLELYMSLATTENIKEGWDTQEFLMFVILSIVMYVINMQQVEP